MENKNQYNGHCIRCGETLSACAQQGCFVIGDKLNFEIKTKCECQQRGCKHCDPKNEIPLPNFTSSPLFSPEPDFNKCWEDIQHRLESPYFYCIELQNSAGMYLAKKGNDLTGSVYKALRFYGKDGKSLAGLYLFLNQESGSLKDFIVTEHEWV